MKLVVAIATMGRPEQILLTLQQLKSQCSPPDRIVVCPARDEDYNTSHAYELGIDADVVRGAAGSCAQRNAIIESCRDSDLIAFIDDDFYPAPDYFEHVRKIFSQHSDIVLITNHPNLDGASGPGISHEKAHKVCRDMQNITPTQYDIEDTYGGYGCNMVIRSSIVFEHNIRFDERMPLYGWLEDIDFSRSASRYGRIAKCKQLRGVHLGVKRGRTNGVRLGYSQLANPVYLISKGSMSPRYGITQVLRNVANNSIHFLSPEPWVDRRGRLKGNALAAVDLLRGRLRPEAILDLN